MKKLPKSQVEFTLEIPVKDVEVFLDKAAKNISNKVDIKGFRKGKVPYDVLEKTVGKQVLFEEAGQFAIDEAYKKFIEENNISPVDYPKVTVKKMAEGNPISIDVVVSVYPEIELPDYKKIAKEVSKKRKKDIKVEDKEIDESIKYLQNSRAKEISVSREVKKGDIAEVDFEVRMDGVKIEGGDSKNHPVKIGDGKFIPGFEDEILGMKPEEKKEFSLNAPKDYFKKDLAGKKLDFSVKLNNVLEVQLPELNDEFAKSLGGFKDMDELKNSIKEGMLKEKEEKEKNDFRNTLIESIAKEVKADIPDVMIERELDKMIGDMKMDIQQHGLKFEDYLLGIKKTEKEIREGMRPQAELRIKSGLLMEKIAEKEKIKISDEKITEKANEFLLRYKDAKEAENDIAPDQLRAYAKAVLTNEGVLEFLESVD